MKLGLAQLNSGENPFVFDSGKDSWLRELASRLEAKSTRVTGPLRLDLSITKLEPDYYLKGRLEFCAEQTCGRCAESFALPIAHTVELGLAHVKSPGEANSEESEELDIEYFEGPELDLAPIVEEQVLLSLPYAPICKPDCKGLCQSCGLNLNDGPCTCSRANPLNPFARLAQMKL